MVHFFVKPSLNSLLLLLFLFFASSSYAAKVVKVDVICKQTKNPSFCLTILNSKPGGAAGADLITLAQYTVGVARAKATSTISLIKSLIANAKNSTAKSHYQTCLTNFGYDEGALGDIDRIEKLLKSRDYNGVGVAASSVMTDVEDCLSGESPSDPPYNDPSMLPKYADFVEQVADITLIISKFLIQN